MEEARVRGQVARLTAATFDQEVYTMTTAGDDKVRRFWDRYAPRYDRDMRFYDRFLFTGGRSWACSQAAGKVLEVAAGTGLNLPHYPAGIRLTGIDASPAMLAIARRRATDLGMHADLTEGDAQALPFASASFDTVICTLSLCCIPGDKAAITEMHRVLRPGGRLILLDHVASGNRLVRAGQRLLERLTLRAAGEYQTRHPLPHVIEAGFVIEHSQRLKAGIVERVSAVKPATGGSTEAAMPAAGSAPATRFHGQNQS
jgi:ubiquinone/menaquinone biosynthesis C-methylase UbiE